MVDSLGSGWPNSFIDYDGLFTFAGGEEEALATAFPLLLILIVSISGSSPEEIS